MNVREDSQLKGMSQNGTGHFFSLSSALAMTNGRLASTSAADFLTSTPCPLTYFMVFLPAADRCMTLKQQEPQTELVSTVVPLDLQAFVILKPVRKGKLK